MIEPEFTQHSFDVHQQCRSVGIGAGNTDRIGCLCVCIISAHRTNAQFSLGRLEEFELERAILLYQKALDRLEHIRHEGQQIQAGLLARYRYRKQIGRKFAAELHDLRSYQAHLRSMIVRLRSGPVQRFKSWLHLDSACFALSRSLTLCLLVIGMLGVCSYLADQPDLLGQPVFEGETITAALATWFAWPPADGRMLDTSSLGGVLLAVATPVLYSYRRAKLHLMHRHQFRALKKFAAADPDRLVHQAPPLAAACRKIRLSAPDIPDERSWFSILGVARSASTDEIKQAYKARVKQNHPDRVGEMSPLFRELAEAETKKINAAYEDAMSLQRA